MASVKAQAEPEAGAALNIQAAPMGRKCDDTGGISSKLAAYRIPLRYVKQLRYVIALPAAQDAPSPRIGPDSWHSKAPYTRASRACRCNLRHIADLHTGAITVKDGLQISII
jgi:hypothetical protein